MEQRTEQQNWEEPIARFFDFVKRNCELEVIDPGDPHKSIPPTTQPFMPMDRMQKYFESHSYATLRDILRALQCESVNPRHIVPRYTAVFCTLLKAGKGKYIRQFTRYQSLNDLALPFDLENPPANLPPTAGDPSFLSDFIKEQWRFCAAPLEEPVSDECFDKERVLPIVFKQKLRDGGSAKLWLVKIHPSYNKLITEEQKEQMGEQNANTFVIKEYSTLDAQKYYDTETSAFNKIGSRPHIIGYYGSFTRNGTFNVILEYADKGTLKEYLEKEIPPSTADRIIQLWKALFQLIHALWTIHAVDGDATEEAQILQGWHQDVKPENILVLSNGSQNTEEWVFKLADLGISHFKRRTSLRADSTASDSYGTHVYGAPEASRPDDGAAKNKLRVKQNIDIWSLGCVYSEVVRWLAEGKFGITQYQSERKEEINKQMHSMGMVDCCFHNGYERLDAVRKSNDHAVRITSKRPGVDFITGDIVANMIQDMLVDGKDRPTAENLWRKQLRIVSDAEKKLQEFRNTPCISNPALTMMERTQPRSLTHPALGPSLNSDPVFPPVLPPEFSPAARTPIQRLSQRNTILSDYERSHVQEPQNIERDDIDQRTQHSPLSPDSIEFGVRNLDFAGRESSPPGVSQTTLPPTPPFSPGTQSVRQQAQVQAGENSFGGYVQRNTTTLPNTTRGASQMTEYPESTYNHSTRGGAMLGTTGVVGHHQSELENSVLGANGHGSPGHWRPGSGASFHSGSLADEMQSEEAYHRQTTANVQANGYQSEGATQLNATPNRQSTGLTETRPHQHGYAGARPALTSPPSNIKRISDVLRWKSKCKSTSTYTSFLDKRYCDRLKDRDHVFLIDDSYSMTRYWDDVVAIVEGLSYILKDADKDGLDLRFTISENQVEQEKHTKKLISMVISQKQKRQYEKTDMNFCLNKLLEKYKAKLDNSKNWWNKKPKPLSLYILTDGEWEANCEPDMPIMNVVKKLSDLRKDREQIGIQFISFGDNPMGLERLRHLDDDLKLELKLDHDIVDTTPSNGDVCKMLLGNIMTHMDNQNSFGSPSGSTLR